MGRIKRGCSRFFWMKDALDLEEVERKDIWIKNQCRSEVERSMNVWGQPGSPFFSYHA